MQTKDEIRYKEYNVGVIVGRFQVAELHKMHKDLIQSVLDRHEKVYLFLGIPKNNELTVSNPLPFDARQEMIVTEFPDVKVLFMKDRDSNQEWVNNLDDQIQSITTSFDKVTVYGSRDSFLNTYIENNGKYPSTELVSTERLSGTECRHDIARKTINSVEFRKGIIYAILNK